MEASKLPNGIRNIEKNSYEVEEILQILWKAEGQNYFEPQKLKSIDYWLHEVENRHNKRTIYRLAHLCETNCRNNRW